MSVDLRYTKKAVAFLDIMGFKNIIKQSEDDVEFRTKLINNLVELKSMENIYTYTDAPHLDYGKKLTAFSDSIVVSYDLSKESAVFYLLFDIIFIQINLVAMGLLLRGGLTLGDVFHDGGVVVGPAMLKAFEMESSIAVYPRIIVDPLLIEYAYENPSHSFSKDKEKELVLSLLCPCENNYYYTNFLSMDSELGYEYSTFLNDVKRLIDEGLKSPNIGVKNKYEWLQKYYFSFKRA